MTYNQFNTCFREASEYANRDAYISDLSLSALWNDAEGADIPAERIAQLGDIWDAAHLTSRDIRHHTGLSQVAFAQRFCIPRRTVEDWESGKGSCAPYLRLLLAQAVGLYKRP